MEETKQVLDLTNFSEEDFTKIKRGLDLFNTNNCSRYFGYVDKTELKTLNKSFGVVTLSDVVVGGLVVAGGILVVQGVRKIFKKQTCEKECKQK